MQNTITLTPRQRERREMRRRQVRQQNKANKKIAAAAHINRVWMHEWMETIRKVCEC